MQRDPGIRFIMAYKFIKGGGALVVAAVLGFIAARGEGVALGHAIARHMHQVTHPWAIRLANALVTALSGRYLVIGALALTMDGVVTTLEGLALAFGLWWGPWLVVLSTSLLLPAEMVALYRHPNVLRALVLIINAVIVYYLARHAKRKRESAGEGERPA